MRKLAGISLVLIALYWCRPITIDSTRPFSKRIFAANGDLLSAHISADEQWRFQSVSMLPQRYVSCLIAFEDRRFYQHIGIDPISVIRAAKDNYQHRRTVSGASTITMQLARMLSSDHRNRNWKNKISEILMAIRLEIWHDKKTILSTYVSMAPFGGNVVGLEAAAWRYFQKLPESLSWAESATLAVLPNAPGLIHLGRNRNLLFQKRNRLLAYLNHKQLIDDLTYSLAIQEEIPAEIFEMPRLAPHYIHTANFKNENTIYSDINFQWQSEIGAIMSRFYHQWRQNNVQNAAVLVVDNKTGEIKTYQANIPNTSEERDVDMILAHRSSGSILKPLLYAAAIDRGLITPNSLLVDVPLYINGFHPTNYDDLYSGAVPADEALSKSLNVPFVSLLQQYGVDGFLQLLKKFQFSSINKSADHYGLSLILGGAEVSLFELVYAYRQLSHILISNDQQAALSPAAIYSTFNAMREVSRPSLHGNWEKFNSSIPMAWKTGTSFGHRDAWAVATTPSLTIGVWVGNADGEGRDGIIGAKTAGELLFAISDILSLPNQWWSTPADQVMAEICSESGHLATTDCTKIENVMVPTSSLNTAPCTYHVSYWTNENGDRLLPQCIGDQPTTKLSLFQLPPVQANYYKLQHPQYQNLPSISKACQIGYNPIPEMQFIYPANHQVILIPKDLNNDEQAIIFRVAHQSDYATLYWYIDDSFIGKTVNQHRISAKPADGPHRIYVMDDSGNSISQTFEIAHNSLDIVTVD